MDFKTNLEEMNENEDENIKLPSDTLAILNEFLQNKAVQESIETNIEENWQLSQFWYDQKTIHKLSRVCLNLIVKRDHPTEVRIALLSCPSLYKSIKAVHQNGIVRLFEFDTRFRIHGEDFVHYDYNDVNRKDNFLKEFEQSFDIVIADPPFLSEECIESTAKIISLIKKNDSQIIMCSGKIVESWIKKYLGLSLQKYSPAHERNLANEFCSFANFDLDSLL